MRYPKIRWYLDKFKGRYGRQQIFADINIGYSKLDSNGKRRYVPVKLSLGASIEPEYFGKSIKRKEKEVFSFNKEVFHKYSVSKKFIKNKMEIFQTAVDLTASYFDFKEIDPNPQEFKTRLLINLKRKTKQPPKSVLQFINELILKYEDEWSKGIQGSVRPNTIRNYRTVSGFLENYQLAKNTTLLFEDLTSEIYWDIFNTCNKIYKGEIQVINPNRRNYRNKQGYAKSTITKYGEILIGLLLKGVTHNFITKLDLNDRKTLLLENVEPTKELHLTESEILKVLNAKIEDSTLLMGQQFIIIASITGLRVSDICELYKLKPKEYKMSESNETFIGIAIDITKTGKPVIIPLLKHVRTILELNNGKFPKFKDSSANRAIKLLCQLLGINDDVVLTYNYFNTAEYSEIVKKWEIISTHDCRSSMITNLSLHNVPEEIIENITHPKKSKNSKKKAFQGYFKAGLTGHATRFLRAIADINSEIYTYM
ncbi:hypothetical protein [Yeosuana marina]|uniref:hypothetical protein n=1 Tax=Yeosuana marina TaxID=1565536 RepID=UPI0030C80D06